MSCAGGNEEAENMNDGTNNKIAIRVLPYGETVEDALIFRTSLSVNVHFKNIAWHGHGHSTPYYDVHCSNAMKCTHVLTTSTTHNFILHFIFRY